MTMLEGSFVSSLLIGEVDWAVAQIFKGTDEKNITEAWLF